jgi:hemolysin III
VSSLAASVPAPPYSRSEELAHTLTAGLGIVACAIAIPWLAWVAAGDALRLAGAMVFGITALAMFTTSVVYHWEREPSRKQRLRKLDHSAI